MTNLKTKISISSFPVDFSGKSSVSFNEIKYYFYNLHPEMTEKDLYRFLYSLKKNSLISYAGSGIYVIQAPQAPSYALRKPFEPELSSFLSEVKQELLSDLSFGNFVIWETRVLHNFMVQQPGINMVILETQRETTGVAFNHLSEMYYGRIFLSPRRDVIDYYVLQQKDVIIISKLTSQSPKGGRNRENISYAKLEKILVDIFVDDVRFLPYQGNELESIFEEAFRRYLIDEFSLFRYAGRRNAKQKIYQFISEKTNIKLLTSQGENL